MLGGMTNDPANLSPADIDTDILRLSRACEETTHDLAKASRRAATAVTRYKVEHAKAHLRAEGTVADREAHATVDTATELHDAEIAKALEKAAQEAGRNYRAQLDALRTIAANLRPLTVR